MTAACIVTGTQTSGGVSLTPLNSSCAMPTMVRVWPLSVSVRPTVVESRVEEAGPGVVAQDRHRIAARRLRIEAAASAAAERDPPAQRLEVVARDERRQQPLAVEPGRAVAFGHHRGEQLLPRRELLVLGSTGTCPPPASWVRHRISYRL